MNDDRPTSDPDETALDADDTAVGADEPTDGGKMDEYDDAVIAADATGMLAGERMITIAALEQGANPAVEQGESG